MSPCYISPNKPTEFSHLAHALVCLGGVLAWRSFQVVQGFWVRMSMDMYIYICYEWSIFLEGREFFELLIPLFLWWLSLFCEEGVKFKPLLGGFKMMGIGWGNKMNHQQNFPRTVRHGDSDHRLVTCNWVPKRKTGMEHLQLLRLKLTKEVTRWALWMSLKSLCEIYGYIYSSKLPTFVGLSGNSLYVCLKLKWPPSKPVDKIVWSGYLMKC